MKNKFNFKSIILTLTLLTLGVGQVWAGTRTIYFDTNGYIFKESATNFAVYLWNDQGNEWVTMDLVSGTIYSASIPDSRTKCIFCAVDSYGATGWNHRKAQTDDQTLSAYNLYTVTSSNKDNGDIRGSWSTYSATFSVTYDGNGKSSGFVPTDATSYSSGGTVTVSGKNTLAKTGYTFAGWNTKSDGSGTYYAPGATFSISANTTLYAIWYDNNVLGDTNVMFYIQGYGGKTMNYLVNSSCSKASTSYKITDVYSYVNTAKANLSSYDRISNNPDGSWSGNQNTGIQSANGGELFRGDGTISTTTANTAATTASVTGDVLSLSTTCNSATGVYGSKSLYILYYLNSELIGVSYNSTPTIFVPAATTARASTYNVSGLSNGPYTLKTILTDGLVYYIADSDDINVAHSYSITYKDKDGGAYSGSNGASLPSSYTYGVGATLVNGVRSGYDFNGWYTASDCSSGLTTSIGTSETGAKTFYAKWTVSATNSLTVTSTAGGSITTPAGGTHSDIANNTYYNIVASRSEGYKFTGWTKTSGVAVSFEDASALSTRVKTTTAGSATVQANFAAMSNSLSVDESSVYAGTTVTLTATRTNHTLNLKYQYKIGSGSWNTIATTSSTSQTYTIPYANTYQTYYFRVVSTDGSTDITSSNQTVEVKGRIIIKVKNSNNWGSVYLYSWYNDGNNHDTNGGWPGKTGAGSYGQSCSIHATGSEWWEVTITQETSTAQKFILNCYTSGNQYQTEDLNLSDFEHGGCYAMTKNANSKQTLPEADACPAAPTVITSAASSIVATSATLGGNITATGNEKVSSYGYYYSTNSALSSSNLGVGTQVQVGTNKTITGTYSKSQTGLTNGTTYYVIAYATNTFGTSYGSVVNFRTKYVTTVTLNQQGGEGGTTEVTATEGSSMPTGKVAPTKWGYDFGGYYASAGGSGKQYYNSSMGSANNWDGTSSTATIHAKWTAKNCTITLNNQGADSGKEGTTSVSTTYNTNTNLTSAIAKPTKTGYKFQGYWTNTNGNGKQIISSAGNWNANVTIYMSGGKWVYDGGVTLYAYWVKEGKYTFRYGTDGSEDWASADFTQVGATTTWQIENFTIPNKTHFFVGYEGLFYESGLGTGATKSKSVTRAWANAPSAVSETYQGQMVLLPAGPGAGAIGQATGAQGTLKIYSDSKHHNLYVGFEPKGYAVTTGSNTSGLAFEAGESNYYYTNVVTLTSTDASGNFQVKLKTSSGYVATSHGAAENASAVNGRKLTGDANIANGKKGRFEMWSSSTTNNFGLRFRTVYDVTFNMKGHGSQVSKYPDVMYEAKIEAPSPAPTATGYTFGGWYKETTCTNAWNFASDQVTATTTLFAKWTANEYTITLDQQSSATGYGSDGDDEVTATYDAVLPSFTKPTAANGYAFLGFYTEAGGSGLQVIGADGNLVRNVAGYTSNDATPVWTHADDVELYAYYKKAEITTITLNATMFEPVGAGDEGYVVANPTIAPTPTGTTSICWKLLYDNDNPVPGHDVIDDHDGDHPNRVKFSIAGLAAGAYKIRATLHTGDGACGTGTTLSTLDASFTIASAYVVTIQYKCGSDLIQASTTSPGKPLQWTEITAPDDIFGYTFSKWKAGEGITIKDADANGEKASATINYKASFNGILTAIYTKKSIFYFKNTLGWEEVYVNFMSNQYWDGYKGSGNKNNYYSRNNAMSLVPGTTDIYYIEYTGSTSQYITFTSKSQDNAENFWGKDPNVQVVVPTRPNDNGSPQTDFGYYAGTNMFIPLNVKVQTKNTGDGGGADYYNRGYWVVYDPITGKTGYTLEVYNKTDDSSRDTVKVMPFTFNAEGVLEATVDLEAATNYGIKFRRDNGMRYTKNGGTLTNDAEQKFEYHPNNWAACAIKTTAAGDYVFTINCSSSDGFLYLKAHFPAAEGDFQVYYKDNSKPAHPSRMITARASGVDTISFFVDKTKSPMLKARKVNSIDGGEGTITWGALNISGESSQSLSVDSTAVYNFVITQSTAGTIASIENIGAYKGDYYIRCAALNSKWDFYRSDRDHLMTYSSFSESDANAFGEKFSHYKTKWCKYGKNVKFCIANDYSPCISDTLVQDVPNTYNNIDEYGFLEDDGVHTEETENIYSANIRFMWNRKTNKVSRAYVASSTNKERLFLVLRGNNTIEGEDEQAINEQGITNGVVLQDKENWMYEEVLYILPGTRFKLFACYAEATPTQEHAQYFRGNWETGDAFISDGNSVVLIGGSGTKQKARIIYDFKTNRLMAAWIPSGADVSGDRQINADVLVEREHQEPAQYITFANTSSQLSGVKTVYGAMKFNRWILNNRQNSSDDDPNHGKTAEQIATHHAPLPVGQQKSIYERSLYFISFPFDVNANEIFGFGHYWDEWYLEYYDGLNRAKNGYWEDSPPNWKYVTPSMLNDFVLKANEGYILGLDLDFMKADNFDFWSNGISTVELFFPSTAAAGTLKQTNVTIPALSAIEGDPYRCTINRGTTEGDRRVKDSYWRCLGVPSFNIYNTSLTDGSGNPITWQPSGNTLPFIYAWNKADNTLTAQSTSTFTFLPMHAYLVQNGGEIRWTNVSANPASPIVARRVNEQPATEYEWRLALMSDSILIDQTYIKMSNLEQVTDTFDFNQDLIKEFNTYRSDIYTYIGNERVAANSMPLQTEQTTVIPVGVKIKTAGEYTFAMPDGTNGVGVTLIDTETGVRTSLGLMDYTVTLTAGSFNQRFFLEISPVSNVATDIELINDENGENGVTGVRKVLIDNKLFIIKDGEVYDARGAKVK